MADGGGMHRHYRVALVTGAVAAAALGAVAFAAVAPGAAAVAGVGIGVVGLYAGGHWARRKLGIKSTGRKWRPPRSRVPGLPGARRGAGGRVPGTGTRLPRLGGLRGGKGSAGRLPSLRGSRTGGSAGLLGPGRGRARAARPAGRAVLGGAGTKRLLGAAPARAGARKGAGRLPRLPALGTRRGAAGKVPKLARRGGRMMPRLGGRGGPAAKTRQPGRAARTMGKRRPGEVPGARRARTGKRKGRWQRYRKAVPAAVPGRVAHAGATAVGWTVAAPFLLAFLSGRAVWRTVRRRKVPAPAPPAPAAEVAPPAPPPVPEAAPKLARPGRTGLPLHDHQKGPHIVNHIDAASEAAAQHIGGWEPENATDLDAFLAGLPSYFEAVSGAFQAVADRLADSYPVHPSVPERLREIAATIGGMADFSGEAHAAHRAMHERELERLESPRRNESFWDVTQNQ